MMHDFAAAQYLMTYGREGEGADLLERAATRPSPPPRSRRRWARALEGDVRRGLVLARHPVSVRVRRPARSRSLARWRSSACASGRWRPKRCACCITRAAASPKRCSAVASASSCSRCRAAPPGRRTSSGRYLLMDSEIRAGDTIAVRTIREQLSRRAKDHPSLQSFADVAHATYLTLARRTRRRDRRVRTHHRPLQDSGPGAFVADVSRLRSPTLRR